MGFESYDRAPEALETQNAAMSQNSFINRVFGWMTAGLALSGVVAYAVAQNVDLFIKVQKGMIVIFILELVVVIGLSAALRSISSTMATLGFLFFAALNGLTLSVIFVAYEPESLTATFFVTSGMFGAMGLYGWMTRRDLTGVGSFCFMGLIGLIIASIVSIFVSNPALYMAISVIGVLIFVGLTAYDMQKIKLLAAAVGGGEFDSETGRKAAVIGALQLYLDFVNLFLYLLRLFGRRR